MHRGAVGARFVQGVCINASSLKRSKARFTWARETSATKPKAGSVGSGRSSSYRAPTVSRISSGPG
jgi:hypothetical protein